MRAEAPAPPPASAVKYEPCDECGAPLDPQQRYCVECAARRGNGANPSSRYFSAMSKKARRRPARARAKAGGGSRAAAVAFFALLPVAVALGVVVGRSGGDGNDEALLQALREQDAAASQAAVATTASTAGPKGAKKQGKQGKNGSSGKVVAQTDNGAVHQIAGFKPTAQKTEEDTRLVENNVKQAGKTYIEAQQNLPDVVVVGGDPDSAPSLPTGAQP